MNGFTIFFLVNSDISVLACILFSSSLLAVLIRKRTMGTLLLWITFLSTTFAEILLGISFHLEALSATTMTTVTEALSYTSYILFASNIVFLYAFGNRLILRDNSFIQLVYFVGFVFPLALPVGLIFKNILEFHDPNLYTKVSLTISNLSIVMPVRSIALLAIMGPLGISAFLRIVIKAIRIQRGTKDKIARAGFKYIWQGTFLWYMGYTLLFATLWYIPVFSTNPVLIVIIFMVKLIFSDIIGFLLLYLGWVMPDWLKRRLGTKSWIAKVYTGEIKVSEKKETTKSFVYKQEEHTQQQKTGFSAVVEVSDK